MPGGSFVASFAGVAHAFHYEEEAGDTIRLTIDGKVVMLEQERDPSMLTAPYAGKLTRYVVEDGAHLSRGDPYAEVEVMKMLFLLTTSEAGVLHLSKVSKTPAFGGGGMVRRVVLTIGQQGLQARTGQQPSPLPACQQLCQ